MVDTDLYTFEEAEYNLWLLVDAKYVVVSGFNRKIGNLKDWIIVRMTNNGHDFLDSVRNDSVWENTLDKVQSSVGTASLELLKDVAISIGKKILLGS